MEELTLKCAYIYDRICDDECRAYESGGTMNKSSYCMRLRNEQKKANALWSISSKLKGN